MPVFCNHPILAIKKARKKVRTQNKNKQKQPNFKPFFLANLAYLVFQGMTKSVGQKKKKRKSNSIMFLPIKTSHKEMMHMQIAPQYSHPTSHTPSSPADRIIQGYNLKRDDLC